MEKKQWFPYVIFGFAFLLSVFVPLTDSFANLVPYDNFSGAGINSNRWTDYEFVREIRDFNGQRKLFSKTVAYGSDVYNSLYLIHPSYFSHLEADVTVTEVDGNYGPDVSNQIAVPEARIDGSFYNDGTGSSGSYVGDVLAEVYLTPYQGQLKSRWTVLKFNNSDASSWDFLGSGDLSTGLDIGQAYKLSLDWDPATKTFTFSDGVSASQTFQTQDTLNPPKIGFKSLRTEIPILDQTHTHQVSDPNLWGKVAATFANVLASGRDASGNAVLINDDFSAAQIDQSKWSGREFVREIENGQLVTKINGANKDDFISFKNPDLVNEIQAKVTINEFNNPDGAFPIAMIGGRFYNDTGNPNSGLVGDVGANVYIGGNGTSPVARWSVFRYTDLQRNFTTVSANTLSIPINLGSTYILYLKWDGTQFTFRCTDQSGQQATAYYTPATSIYPANNKWKGLGTETFPPSPTPPSYVAYVSASFDDVMVNAVSKIDFNGDGKSDILWRNASSGEVFIWSMNGLTSTSQGSAGLVSPTWQIMGTGDFNSDGKSDILWRNSATGEVFIWSMNGLTSTSQGSAGLVSPTWQIMGTGDFNSDGKSDILWRNSATGEVFIWLMNGNTISSMGSLGIISPTWQIMGTGDFDGDGNADILWRNSATGEVFIWLMNGLTIKSMGSLGIIPLTWQIMGTGDFDGDGNADILWRNSATGEVFIWLMNGLTSTSQGSAGLVSPTWQIMGTGDFNSDGKSDILWRNSASGEVFIWLMNGLTSTAQDSPGTVADLNWQIVR